MSLAPEIKAFLEAGARAGLPQVWEAPLDVIRRNTQGRTVTSGPVEDVHEVINRCDIFAVRLSDHKLTVLSGKLQVEHLELACSQVGPKQSLAERGGLNRTSPLFGLTTPAPKVDTVTVAAMKKQLKHVKKEVDAAQQILDGMQ